MVDIFAVFAVLLLLVGSMFLINRFGKKLDGEVRRKTLHILIGLTAIVFPLVFTYKISIVILGVLASFVLFVIRKSKRLKKGLASSIHDVERKSHGEFYLTLSIILVFLISDSYVSYLISILILTFADSIAALVGVNYAKKWLSGPWEDAKSREGSLMLFIVAFLCTLIPLQLMTTVGRLDVLLISFIIAILAMLIEATSQTGNDNLLLPVLTNIFVTISISESTESLVFTSILVVIFFIISIILYRFVKTSKIFVMFSILIGYIILILGGFYYTLLAVLFYVLFGILPKATEKEKSFVMNYKVAQINIAYPLVCVILQGILTEFRDVLFLGFALSVSTLLLMNTYNRFLSYTEEQAKKSLVFSGLKGFLTLGLPSLVIYATKFSPSIFLVWIFIIFYAFSILVTPIIFKKNDMSDAISIKTMMIKAVSCGFITSLFILGGILWTILH